MNARQWIDAHSPIVPPSLAQRIGRALDVADAPPVSVDGVMIDASMNLLDAMLGEPDDSRRGAMTLLAADALITWAFEAAATQPARLDALASSAMQRIAQRAERGA
jgi:hypothetical protein